MQLQQNEIESKRCRLYDQLMTIIHTGGGTSAQRSLAGTAVEEFFEVLEEGLTPSEKQCCVLDCWDTLVDMAPWVKWEMPDALLQLQHIE